jgi:hypothetical protein
VGAGKLQMNLDNFIRLDRMLPPVRPNRVTISRQKSFGHQGDRSPDVCADEIAAMWRLPARVALQSLYH